MCFLSAQLCTHASSDPCRRVCELDAAVGDANVLIRIQATCGWLLGAARLRQAPERHGTVLNKSAASDKLQLIYPNAPLELQTPEDLKLLLISGWT